MSDFPLPILEADDSPLLGANEHDHHRRFSEYSSAATTECRIGLALNGGGFRAPICAAGFLRGLHQLGLLEKITHVAGVSGGSISTAILAYSPTELDTLLAMERVPTPPGSIPDYSKMPLDEMNEKAMHSVLAGDHLRTVSGENVCGVLGRLFVGGVPLVGLHLLQQALFLPMGFDGLLAPAAEPKTSANNPVTATRPGRPQPVITFCCASVEWPNNLVYIESVRRANALVMEELGVNKDGSLYQSEDVTAAALKARDEVDGAYAVQFDLSGGTVGTFTHSHRISVRYGCCATQTLRTAPGRVSVADFNLDPDAHCLQGCVGRVRVDFHDGAPFTVAHAVLASSMYVSILLAEDKVIESFPVCLERLFRKRSVQRLFVNRGLNIPMSVPRSLLSREAPCASRPRTPMSFTDGGQNDTTGVLTLLARRVQKIIAMQTGGTEYRTLEETGDDLTEGVEPGLMALFGMFRSGYEETMIVSQATVFPIAVYKEMRSQLDACRAAGEPLVAVLKDTPVLANPFIGVDGGWMVDLCVYYIDEPQPWKEAVPESADVGPLEDGKDFPIIAPFGFFSNRSVNLVTDLVAWAVISSKEKLVSFVSSA